jgi:hypothetical protein
MIEASATADVPWGYVCGYPTRRGKQRRAARVSALLLPGTVGRFPFVLIPNTTCLREFLLTGTTAPGQRDAKHPGDLYGGAHYSQSSSAALTPQGRAIASASRRFGDGRTLPFTPCKRGYIPVVGGRPMLACHLHDRHRRRRFRRERSTFRAGEVDLSVWWTKPAEDRPCLKPSTAQRKAVEDAAACVVVGGVSSAEPPCAAKAT